MALNVEPEEVMASRAQGASNIRIMIKELLENNCIKIGSFKLKSGDISKYYYDMKNLISNPPLLANISDELYKLMDECDIICGVPIGGLPISTCISVKYNKPMIIVRDEAKEYGTKKCIEGNYTKTDKCIIIDDVISSGSSVQKVVDILLEEVNLVGVVVVIDRLPPIGRRMAAEHRAQAAALHVPRNRHTGEIEYCRSVVNV